MDHLCLHSLLHLVLVFAAAAQYTNNQNNSTYNDIYSNTSESTTSMHRTTMVLIQTSSSDLAPKNETPKETPNPTSSTAQCLVGKKEAQVLLLCLGVTLVVCVVLLVTTVVLAFQLHQQQQWHPSPRPLRSNADFICIPDVKADEGPEEAGPLLVQVEKLEEDGNSNEEPKQSPTNMSSDQETTDATASTNPAPEADPSPVLSTEPAAGEDLAA